MHQVGTDLQTNSTSNMGIDPMCHSPLALNKPDSMSQGQPHSAGLSRCSRCQGSAGPS